MQHTHTQYIWEPIIKYTNIPVYICAYKYKWQFCDITSNRYYKHFKHKNNIYAVQSRLVVDQQTVALVLIQKSIIVWQLVVVQQQLSKQKLMV